MSRLSKELQAMGACEDAVEWATKYCNYQEAWDACWRADWMLWLLARIADRKIVVRCICACARTALPLAPKGDARPLAAIQTAEKWADGHATLTQVKAAAADAYAAYAAAYAAADAAYAAADDAADAADAYAAAAAADDAAYAAYAAAAYAAYAAAADADADAHADAAYAAAADAYAAYAAAYAAADAATRESSLSKMAALVRKRVQTAPILRRRK